MDNRTNISPFTGTETIIGTGTIAATAEMGREWMVRGVEHV